MNRKLTMLGLFLVFFVPLFVAVFLYFSPHQFDSLRANAHGTLINPPQSLPSLLPPAADKTARNADLLPGKWTLLYWSQGRCDLHCEAGLFKMRQVRLSLGKYIARVQTVYLSPRSGNQARVNDLKRRHPKLIFAAAADGVNRDFITQMQQYPSGEIYLVDGFGNLVMRYSDAAESKGMLRDLKKLLSVSGNV